MTQQNEPSTARDMCGECLKDDLDCECCPICLLSNCEHDATDWLLHTKANAEFLRESIAQMEAGNTVEGDLDETKHLLSTEAPNAIKRQTTCRKLALSPKEIEQLRAASPPDSSDKADGDVA